MTTLRCSLLVVFSLVLNVNVKCLDIKQHEGNYSQVMSFTVNVDTEHVLVFPERVSKYPYRIDAWSLTARTEYPILMVVRQEKEVISWQIPFVTSTSKKGETLEFSHTSRTLCPNNMHQVTRNTRATRRLFIAQSQKFIVGISTASIDDVIISVQVEEELNFYIDEDKKYSITISPSQPWYYYYACDGTNNAMIKVDSDDDLCFIVSIQDSYVCACPVSDLDSDISYTGKYQTINKKGGLSIRSKDYPDGFFLVFVVKADDHICVQQRKLTQQRALGLSNRSTKVTFSINKGLSGSDYAKAVGIIAGVFAGFCMIAIAIEIIFSKWGTKAKFKKTQTHNVSSNSQALAPVLNKDTIKELLKQDKLTLDLFAQVPKYDKRNSRNYAWFVFNVTIFYGIPVTQLVNTYQIMINTTGDEDMCYYNFFCANPLGIFSDFNHIYSNVGYAFMGILFLCMVYFRHRFLGKYTTGIPVHDGIFYAMGIALISEGVLSACYHVCPSQTNFQFDTSFMYVMAVLSMVALYQNRHPDIAANAYATFTILGLVIILALMGILIGVLGFHIFLIVLYLLFCFFISFRIYFVTFIIEGLKELVNAVKQSNNIIRAFIPLKKSRFYVLTTIYVINCAVAITGLVLYNNDVIDFASFILMLLMMNAFIYTIFYTIMKVINSEKICFEAGIYGILGIASWIASGVFFLQKSTMWTLSPADSRQLNEECLLLDFYDKHDIWHFVSAPALYLSFMYLLCLDDDILGKPRNEIAVF